MYRQEIIATDSSPAWWVALKIRSKWVDGILLDCDGSLLSLPHQLEKGKKYIIQVGTGKDKLR